MKVSFCQEELELTLEQEFKFAQYRAEINQINDWAKISEYIHVTAQIIKQIETILVKYSDFQVSNEYLVFKVETEKALASVLKMTLQGKKQFLLKQLEYSLWLDCYGRKLLSTDSIKEANET